MPLLDETLLDEVTGGAKPWNFPFDSGSAPTTPAAEKVIHAMPGTAAKHIGTALDTINQMALQGKRYVARVSPAGQVIAHAVKK